MLVLVQRKKNHMKKCEKNVLKSYVTLLIPTIFNSYQSLELFLKGLLLLNGIEVDNTHEVSDMIVKIKNVYGDKSDIYKKINSEFYHDFFSLIEMIMCFSFISLPM